jgi:hypothetical protein
MRTQSNWNGILRKSALIALARSPLPLFGWEEPNRSFVFVHTSGYNLRQRIHEFRPDSRLFLVFELAGREEAHNKAVGLTDAFHRSMEAFRAAKLSGFLVAAHVTVTTETDPCDIGELIEFLDKRDVDGFMVTAGRHLDPSIRRNLEDSRSLIRFGRWERFSALLDASYAQPAPAKLISPSENAFEEGD